MEEYLQITTVGKILGRYTFCGFPIINDITNPSECMLYFNSELFDELYQIKVPNDITKELIKFVDIHQFNCSTKTKSFNIFMNMDFNYSKPYVWVLHENKWYKFFIEQCSARYQSNDRRIFECQNLVISPGNGIDSMYSEIQYGCCIAHVQGRCRFFPNNYNYSCRACWKCVSQVLKPNEQSELNQMIRTECAVKMECLSVYANKVGYYNAVGNLNLYKKFIGMGMDFKLNNLKYEKQIKFTPSSQLYKSRLNHSAKHYKVR